MSGSKLKLHFIFIFLFLATNLMAENEIKCLQVYQFVHVQDLQHYTSNVHVDGTNPTSREQRFYFSLAQTEELITKSGSYSSNGKSKRINLENNLVISTVNWSSVFNGYRTYSFSVPPNTDFTFDYEVAGYETIFQCGVAKGGDHDAVDFKFELTVPENLIVSLRGSDSTFSRLIINSTSFTEKEKFKYFLIHPKNENPNTYFNNWCTSRYNSLPVLDANNIPQEIQTIAKLGDKTKLAEACFNYVQKNISYLAIEDGLNAIIPRDANQTLKNKYGDCKDMAMLLNQLLQYYGFESYITISKTTIKEDSYDFPSIALANHEIVTLILNSQAIYLDCTESYCKFGDPSLQILGTEGFILDSKGGKYMYIENKLNSIPSLTVNYDLIPQTVGHQFQMEIDLTGKFTLLLKGLEDYSAASEKVKQVINYLIPYAYQVDSIRKSNDSFKICISGTLPSNYFNSINGKTYLDLKVLPDFKHILHLVYNEEFALFPGTFQYNLRHLKSKFTTNTSTDFVVNQEENSSNLVIRLDKNNTFKNPVLEDLWKQFVAKPAIYTP